MEQIPAVMRLVRKYDLPADATEEQILRAVVENADEGLSLEAGKLLRMISDRNGRDVAKQSESGYG